jgi:hypothetical protein
VWLEANAEPGSSIILEAYGPWVNPRKFRVIGVNSFAKVNGALLKKVHARYVVVASLMYNRFVSAPAEYPRESKSYERLFRKHCEVFSSGDVRREAIRIFDLSCKK